jgi:DNA gyrase subunit A
VTLIALDNGTKLSGLQRIVENDTPADAEADENQDSTGAPGAEGTEGT